MNGTEKLRVLLRPARRLIALAVVMLPVLYFHTLPGLSTWAKVLVGVAGCGITGFSLYLMFAMIANNVDQRNTKIGVFTLFTFGLLSLYTVILSH